MPNGGKIKARVPCENKEKYFARLAEVLADAENWERRLKEYALKYILEEWGSDNGIIGIWGSAEEFSSGSEVAPITQEDFLKRIKVCSIIVFDDRSLRFGIDADDMFTDHILSVWADIGGNITECGLSW